MLKWMSIGRAGQFKPRHVGLRGESGLLGRVRVSRHEIGRQHQHDERHHQRADAHPLAAAVQQQGGCQGEKQDDEEQCCMDRLQSS